MYFLYPRLFLPIENWESGLVVCFFCNPSDCKMKASFPPPSSPPHVLHLQGFMDLYLKVHMFINIPNVVFYCQCD